MNLSLIYLVEIDFALSKSTTPNRTGIATSAMAEKTTTIATELNLELSESLLQRSLKLFLFVLLTKVSAKITKRQYPKAMFSR